MMKLTKQTITDISEKAKTLVAEVDEKYRQTTYSVIFSKLLSLETNEIQNTTVKGKQNISSKIQQTSTKKGPKSQLITLVNDGFFKSLRSIPDIINELDKRNRHYKQTDLTRPLESLVHNRILRRDKKKIGNKEIWHYSNW